MKKYLPAIFANVSAALSEILLMASAAWLIASAALQPPLSALSVGITLVRTAGISRAALRYADRFLSHKIIFRLLDELREKLFRQAAARISYRSGEVLRELTVTADLLKDFLPRVILSLSTAALVTILLTIFLSQSIGFVALILPAIFLLAIILAWCTDFVDADDSIYREKILDFSDAQDELKIYGVKPAIDKLNDSAGKFSGAQIKIQTRQIFFDTAIKILAAAGICFILTKIGAHSDRIELTVWALILIAALEFFATIPPAIRTYKKIRGVKLAENNFVAQIEPTDFALEFRGVDFGYDSRCVLENFSLKIERGEHWAIIGESGAGKTTLLYLAMKIFAPESGVVAVNGTIGAATSTNYIFAESIGANFRIYHEEISDAEILAALRICQLENFGVDTPANLSGGELARLQAALALAKNPDILILDEPTAGLDRICAEKFIDAVISDSAKKNRTLIVITHDLNVAAKFEKILNLNLI